MVNEEIPERENEFSSDFSSEISHGTNGQTTANHNLLSDLRKIRRISMNIVET